MFNFVLFTRWDLGFIRDLSKQCRRGWGSGIVDKEGTREHIFSHTLWYDYDPRRMIVKYIKGSFDLSLAYVLGTFCLQLPPLFYCTALSQCDHIRIIGTSSAFLCPSSVGHGEHLSPKDSHVEIVLRTEVFAFLGEEKV